MPEFNVGDRVKCKIRVENSPKFGVVGIIYTVCSVNLENNIKVSELVDENGGSWLGGWRFQVVEDVPEQQYQEQFVLIMISDQELLDHPDTWREHVFVVWCNSVNEADREEAWYLNNGCQILGKKKLKLSYQDPVLAFNNVAVDDNDNLIEEDDDD